MSLLGSRPKQARFLFALRKSFVVIAVCIHRLCENTHRHFADTLNADTTLDIHNTQATVSDCNKQPAHSRLRNMFGYVAERASPTGYEPKEPFEDLASHNFADSVMSSIAFSSG